MPDSYEYGPHYRIEFLDAEHEDTDVELEVMKGDQKEGTIYMAVNH